VNYSLYSSLLFIWIGFGIATFFLLLKVTAPFGRYASTHWGPVIDNRIAWFVMEATVLVTFWYFVFPLAKNLSFPALIISFLFTLHYINRAFIFPFRIRTKKKKMPVVIMFSAILFNIVNGSALGYFLTHFSSYTNEWLNDWRFILGAILFFSGMIINWRADNTLIHLRKKIETGYQIPYGELFGLISCPNHFGEIAEWFGFALLSWCLPAAAFFIWTSANLLPRSLAHHRWYKQHFPDYPSNRKAVIPFFM